MGHTPGPWGYDAERREIFSDTDEHGCGWIALVLGNDSNERRLPPGEQAANANLIAAAPDLLAACEELLIYLGDWDDMENETCAAARKAIAKAKGGA